ncbi:MAG: hypothetical protein AAGN35_26025 [Bacteroidota bacterium]
MKKVLLLALLGLFAALPGMAAEKTYAAENVAHAAEIDPVLAEAILRAAAHASGQDADALINGYIAGGVTITKEVHVYTVSQERGAGIAILEEGL